MYLCVWRLVCHFTHFLKLFRQPFCHLYHYTSSPAPSTYTLHVVTTDIYLQFSRYSSARGILCACVFLVKVQLNRYRQIKVKQIHLFLICTVTRSEVACWQPYLADIIVLG